MLSVGVGALWLIGGEAPAGTSAMELMRSRYAQLLYQPPGEVVTLRGVPPGRYTLVWASFHTETPGGAVVRSVDVGLSPTEVSLVR